jgi:acyl-CoA thioesterase-2
MSAWADHPGYRVELLPQPARVRVWQGGTLLADSRRTLLVRETAHAEVVYFPAEDVRIDLFERSDRRTVCPFKGEASYWSLARGERPEADLAWSYPAPLPEVAGLAGRVAFYAGRVRVEAEGETASQVGDLAELLDAFDPYPLGEGRFLARNLDGRGRDVVDGSQMLAQSIVAACKCVPGKSVKSAHMVFSRAANVHEPLRLDAEVLHAGRSFASVTVTARQGERACARGLLLLDAETLDLVRHQAPMPEVPGPDACPPYEMGVAGRELRIAGGAYTGDPAAPPGPPELFAWLRYREAPAAARLNQALVAHFTGHLTIATAMRPHAGVGEAMAHRTLSTGVLAITVSFHEPVRADQWLLYAHESPHAGRGLAYGRAQVFSQSGRLLASFSLEAMLRGLEEAALRRGPATGL